ncbi:alpha/beta fold hydrolase BchO [Stappia sp. ES.058]|uniref:alpha/beta fold hydrolase BchO n=1 Tax=Stappia sp. ES.058 TaxID=1881061 RepID=UPI00087B591E|nr:alpha/beta fold hydrolase BchO [Stappia sp. ES.058]SDT96535.1 magnesium chelatase accessory protein [Stappia sp. ES.058]
MAGFTQSQDLDWSRDGHDWPNSDASRFVRTRRILWHIQEMGDPHAPAIVLVHGTAASTHSFRDLMPRLAARFRVIAFDLPGHGFTEARDTQSLTPGGMADAISGLLRHLDIMPLAAAGHSAGAAVLIRMAQLGGVAPAQIFGLNAALEPIQGNALFQPLARVLFLNPLTPRLLAWRATLGGTDAMLRRATGSEIGTDGARCYARLFASRRHVRAALGMMAHWDLAPLQAALPSLDRELVLIAADDDPMVPASVSTRAAARARSATCIRFATGGHLLHEAEPDKIATLIEERCFSRASPESKDRRSA